MVFASDLDMTLVYSDKFLPYKKEDLLVAEYKRDGRQAYMSKTAFNNLKQLIDGGLIFVPTTARTHERFSNIHLLQELPMKYIISGNGRNIIVDGKVDNEWNEYVENSLRNKKYSIDYVVELVTNYLNKENLNNYRLYNFEDYLSIFSYTVRNFITDKQQEEIRELLKDTGWEMYVCNRKMYITAKEIDKREALDFLKKKYLPNEEFVIAGDSFSDYKMLNWGDYNIVPKHGDVLENMNRDKIFVTNEPGIRASVEIMDVIEKAMEN